MSLFEELNEALDQSGPNENRIEIMVDFRGHVYITQIYEDDNPRTSNYELFNSQYENFDSQEIIQGLPNDLVHGARYLMRFHVNIEWDYEHTDCDVYINYVKDSLVQL